MFDNWFQLLIHVYKSDCHFVVSLNTHVQILLHSNNNLVSAISMWMLLSKKQKIVSYRQTIILNSNDVKGNLI